jgi:uncharacterized protein involved in copper resistance
MDSHTMDSHTMDSRTMDSRTMDSRTMDSRTMDSRTMDSRTMDSRTMDSRTMMPTQKIFRDTNRPPSDVRTTDRYLSNQPRNSNKKGWTIVENKRDSTKKTSNLDA